MKLAAKVTEKRIGGLWQGLPCTGRITALFGVTDDVHAQPHSGVDTGGVDDGTTLEGVDLGNPAVGGAVVVLRSIANDGSAWSRFFGNSVVLRTEDGYRILIAHMQEPTPWNVGDWVPEGAFLGRVGATGMADGPHVHIGISDDANPNFSKDQDGGVSRLYDPLAFVEGEPEPVREVPDALAHADSLYGAAGTLRYMVAAGVPAVAQASTRQLIEDELRALA